MQIRRISLTSPRIKPTSTKYLLAFLSQCCCIFSTTKICGIWYMYIPPSQSMMKVVFVAVSKSLLLDIHAPMVNELVDKFYPCSLFVNIPLCFFVWIFPGLSSMGHYTVFRRPIAHTCIITHPKTLGSLNFFSFFI